MKSDTSLTCPLQWNFSKWHEYSSDLNSICFSRNSKLGAPLSCMFPSLLFTSLSPSIYLPSSSSSNQIYIDNKKKFSTRSEILIFLHPSPVLTACPSSSSVLFHPLLLPSTSKHFQSIQLNLFNVTQLLNELTFLLQYDMTLILRSLFKVLLHMKGSFDLNYNEI